MKKFKKIVMLCFMMCLMMFCMTGCRKPYDKPEFVTIEASQTAFLIPLVGDTSDQASFASEALLEQAKVATKEVQIPHRWVQLGRMNWVGEWRASARLIVVERKPVSRSWESGNTPEESGNAIWGGTNDGVGVYVGMSCSAQINEQDATKFLYRFNNTPLEQIIDNEIKTMVRDTFNSECRKYSSTELNANKNNIVEATKQKVAEHFKEYGVTITVLGTNEDFSYENPKIQEAIDNKYVSEQNVIIQANNNRATIARVEADAQAATIKANAEAEVLRIAAQAEADANRKIAESITPELLAKMDKDNERIKYENWKGDVPQVQGSDAVVVNMAEKAE